MQQSKLRLVVNGCRAVSSANIQIGDITVLSGVNACGKSTLAHLVHTLVNLSRDYASLACDYAWRPVFRMTYALVRFGSQMQEIADSDESSSDNEPMFSTRKLAFGQDWGTRRSAFFQMLEMAFYELGRARIKNGDEAERCYKSFLSDVGFDVTGSLDEPTVQAWFTEQVSVASAQLDALMKSRSSVVWGSASRESVKWMQYPGSVYFYEGETCVYSSDADKRTLKEILGVEHAFYIESPWRNQIGVDAETGAISVGDGFDFSGADDAFVPEDDLFSALEGRIDERPDDFASYRMRRLTPFRRKRLVYARADGHEPFPIDECATGIKSLSLLDFLYTRGCLNNKTLLVIDEPEAHLHPQWILEYAKILVRLNRRLGVRLLITTHSPDMLNAIRRVANVEEVADLHFYLADEVSSILKYDFNYLDLGRNVEPIFAKFNLAADRTESYPDDK